MESKVDLVIAPKNSIIGAPLFTYDFLFVSEGCKLPNLLRQSADMTTDKPWVLTHGVKCWGFY